MAIKESNVTGNDGGDPPVDRNDRGVLDTPAFALRIGLFRLLMIRF